MADAPGTTTESMLANILLPVMRQMYADVMPAGFRIHLIAEYAQERFPAPNLWLEKRGKPASRYVAILVSDTASVPALGETVTDAINSAIAKIEARDATAH